MAARRVVDVTPEIGLRAWSGPTHNMSSAHRHHDLEFNYVIRGAMTYLIGGEVATIPEGRLGVMWAALPHQTIQVDDRTRVFWICVPLTRALLWGLPEPFTRELLSRGLIVDSEHRPSDLPMLDQWDQDLRRDSEMRRSLVLREVEARLHRLALDAALRLAADRRPARRRRAAHAGVASAVQRMAEFIAHRFHEPISVQAVADVAALHPNYAMTLFRSQTGMTINDYITRQRVAHAQRLLATTEAPILDVGYDSGFGSPSRFFQAFKEHAGCSPRQFRLKLTRG